LRDKIDPAHDLTFFCFLLGFRVIEFRRDTEEDEVDLSRDGRGSSAGAISGEDGVERLDLARSEELELTGRDFVGEASPDASPKKKNFFEPRGVRGAGLSFPASSLRKGTELRLWGPLATSSAPSSSIVKTSPAVLGRDPLF
jgi:hypothetical protein